MNITIKCFTFWIQTEVRKEEMRRDMWVNWEMLMKCPIVISVVQD